MQKEEKSKIPDSLKVQKVQKVYILAKDVNTERKFKIKTKQIRPEKGLFLVHPDSYS